MNTKTNMSTREEISAEIVIEVVGIDLLDPNPRNPRPINRQHVDELKQIISQDPGGMARHRIQVRRKDERFEIINGHHRLIAFKEIGFPEVSVQIDDMNEKEAAIEVLRANRNLPLDMLAIGRHYSMVAKDFKVPQKQYAETIGKLPQYVNMAIKVADVYNALPESLKSLVDAKVISHDAVSTHLLEISRAPEENWEGLVASVLENDMTISQIKEQISTVAKMLETAAAESGIGISSVGEGTILDEDGEAAKVQREPVGESASGYIAAPSDVGATGILKSMLVLINEQCIKGIDALSTDEASVVDAQEVLSVLKSAIEALYQKVINALNGKSE